MVAQQLGQDIEETEEQQKLRYRLENVGLTREQAKEIVSMYDADVIAQQLDWLPYRHAKNPAGYLLAAIEGNYDEPRAVRQERLLRELHYQEQLLRQEYQQQEQQQQPVAGPQQGVIPQAELPAQPPEPQDEGDEEEEPEEQARQLSHGLSHELPEPASPGTVDVGALGEDESVSLTPDG